MGILRIYSRGVTLESGSAHRPDEDVEDDIVDHLIRAIRSVRYGQVQILIQDSDRVNIEEIP
jgi:hypothetical protein